MVYVYLLEQAGQSPTVFLSGTLTYSTFLLWSIRTACCRRAGSTHAQAGAPRSSSPCCQYWHRPLQLLETPFVFIHRPRLRPRCPPQMAPVGPAGKSGDSKEVQLEIRRDASVPLACSHRKSSFGQHQLCSWHGGHCRRDSFSLTI